MPLTAIPCLFMRGGTSRGPYVNRKDLPGDRDTLSKVLLAALGAGHPLCIDGIGGSETVTTKVAMLSPSEHAWAEVDFFFAQVGVGEPTVDYSPSCGNILAGVGPAAIEMGLVPALNGETAVKIRNVNTETLVEAMVQTPDRRVEYEGPTAIDGVPGTAAPITLNFMDIIGSKTGALFPTGQAREEIDGITVTCIDVAMPMVVARAADFGLTGYESKAELDENNDFFCRMEPTRCKAGERMGLGDVSSSVIPKFGLLSPPRVDGTVTSRYFMPKACHPSHAVTGAICIAACVVAPGTIADIADASPGGPLEVIRIEHPSGMIDVALDYRLEGGLQLEKAGVLRTARLLMRGEVMVPHELW